MRSWVFGAGLAAVAAGGVYFVATGGGSPNHCGPCVSCGCPEPTPAPAEAPSTPPVVEVVDVNAVLATPPVPKDLPFVSFDEPPLAKPPAQAPTVIQAAFTELPPIVEVAPMPRSVGPLDLIFREEAGSGPPRGSIGLGNFWGYERLKGSEDFFKPAVELAPMPRPVTVVDGDRLNSPADPY